MFRLRFEKTREVVVKQRQRHQNEMKKKTNDAQKVNGQRWRDVQF